MASINASITNTGIVTTGDATGNLQLQSNGVTGLTVIANGKLNIANTALSTASAGTLEYDGGELYFTPLGTQRGLVPGMQYYRLDSALAGSNASGNQSVFGKSCTLSSNTVYRYEYVISLVKSAGTTSHSIYLLFGGTCTNNNIFTSVQYSYNTVTPYVGSTNIAIGGYNSATGIAGTAAMTTASNQYLCQGFGSISVNAGGTFIPQYNLSAAPGGAYSTTAGSYFLIYPIGAAGADVNVGTWA